MNSLHRQQQGMFQQLGYDSAPPDIFKRVRTPSQPQLGMNGFPAQRFEPPFRRLPTVAFEQPLPLELKPAEQQRQTELPQPQQMAQFQPVALRQGWPQPHREELPQQGPAAGTAEVAAAPAGGEAAGSNSDRLTK